ncbi:hypothetical protein KUTeg_021575 [Tegillarca granosa]|uniref:Major facilitator superfamily (MFS) profile domain-containing protein n=1 Tax=Tegillarca granosa TaxID=220873 RepID=A0ABQ9E8E0_TEGGR|nr:hypothetical protein KUTeg_021575 [Tegillarca granosa]
MASAGTGFGAFFMPLLVNHIFNEYGYTSGFMMISGLFLNLVICGALYRSLALQKKLMAFDRKKKMSKILPNECVLIPVKEKVSKNTKAEHERNISIVTSIENDTKNCSQVCQVTQKSNEKSEHFTTENNYLSKKDTTLLITLKRLKQVFNFTSKAPENGKRKVFDISLLKDYRFLSFAFSVMFFELSHTIINVFLPSFAIQQGIAESQTSYMLSITGIVDTVSRILSGAIMDISFIKPYRIIINNVQMYLLIIVCLVLPNLESFLEFCLLAGIFGWVNGSYFAQKTLILIEILGVEKITSSFGLIMVFQGTGTLIGPPISGMISKGYFGSWKEAFYFGAAVVLFGAGIFSISNIIHHERRRKRSDSSSEQSSPFSSQMIRINTSPIL